MKKMNVFKSPEGKAEILKFYDSILKRWPVPYEALMAPTGYGNTFVISCGKKDAEPMVLIHGSSTNSSMWIGDIAAYSRDYRVYALDIPGEPGKSDENRQDLSTEACVLWMEEVFRFLHIEKAILVGISLGGFMALKFSTGRPEKVAKMVLLCPSGAAPAKISFLFLAILLLPLGRWGVNRLNRILYGKQKMVPEAVEYGNIIMKNFNPIMTPIPIFSDSELKRLTMPVLLIAGKLDVLLPSLKTAARLKELLPDVKIEILQDAGHVLIGFCEKILNFLKQS